MMLLIATIFSCVEKLFNFVLDSVLNVFPFLKKKEVFYGPHLETIQQKRARQRKQQRKFKTNIMRQFKVHNMKFFLHKVFTSDQCTICQMSNDDMYAIPCGHTFHIDCFKKWIETCEAKIHSWESLSAPCPLCKAIVPHIQHRKPK